MKKKMPTSKKRARLINKKESGLFWKKQLRQLVRFDQKVIVAWK